MCKVKSMIVFKDRVYCAEDTDSHCEMLEKLNIKDESKEPNFLRVEISPPEKEFFLPIDEWIYKVDQDYKPEWYVEEIDKARAFEVLKVWAESHIIINRSNFKIEGEGRFYIKNCKDVKACDSSSVTAYGSSSVTAPKWSSVNIVDLKITENATIEDCRTQTIYYAEDWTFIKREKN